MGVRGDQGHVDVHVPFVRIQVAQVQSGTSVVRLPLRDVLFKESRAAMFVYPLSNSNDNVVMPLKGKAAKLAGEGVLPFVIVALEVTLMFATLRELLAEAGTGI